ncbi:alpha-ketoacid dehydrogenase subunit alpha/beta [Mesorhizobium australafricanum]|uniref:2-oxoglutarate dehydrogenase E1 component n=1 Tax=Mesorhizobium australafricanum TaxID=3072311 RepID=A0ABU4X2Z6_9HYPH|nr:thiamine pyrophosphate-dependent enzyme [Mesorhizobium sp. VK3E]MDX8442399.1 thiamine pyrophosphate-dependent enzyme [Mesorhizobium sp. VK3E]
MLRIRRFEEEGMRQYERGNIPGWFHSSVGQEAAIVGACLALRDDDCMTGTHRSHGHTIGKGANLDALMAELMGKQCGICKGRGGSMHFADTSVGIISESGIVGGGIPLATGSAFSAKLRSVDQVTLCFFGDGAVNQGTFHESLNMASLWKLPVVYLCENNGYAMTTPLAQSHGQPDIALRATAYGMPGVAVDGQDVSAVYDATVQATGRSRAGEGPTLIVANTYRFDEHNFGLLVPGGRYRSSEEVETYKRERDPILLFRKALLQEGTDERNLRAIEDEVANSVKQAVEFAVDSPAPLPATLHQYMFKTPLDCLGSLTAGRGEKLIGPQICPEKLAAAPRDTIQSTYLEALVQAQIEEMDRDERVVLIGEDISAHGCERLIERFGRGRIWNMPISEGSFAGLGIGAAINGLRPIIDLSCASFVYLAADQIINQASKLRYMTGGQIQIPIVFRCCMFSEGAAAAQHADRPYPLFMNVPGLKIISPTSAGDIKGLMKSAIRDNDPVLVFEDASLMPLKGDVPGNRDYLIPIGKAEVKHEGKDVTIVAIAGAIRPTMEAVDALAGEGISVEVIDPRTLKPLDHDAINMSTAKTGRLLIVENAHRVCNAGSEIAAVMTEKAFDILKRPILRLSAPDIHVPFSPALEKGFFPTKDQIIKAVRRLL